jgi:8-oxo-dGTP diphosphatase
VNFIFVSVCILKKNNKILFTKRPPKKYYGDYWEFPGGKLEKNETFEEAIQRELAEELGIQIEINNLINLDLINHTYDKKNFIIMSLFCLKKWSRKIKNKDTKDFTWLNIKGPYPKKFLDGGLLILKRLKDGYYKI